LDKAGVKGINELLEVDNFAVETAIGRDALIGAIQSLLTAMADPKQQPTSFYFDCMWHGRLERGLTNVSGLRINHDGNAYALDSGINQCTLRKYTVGADGCGRLQEEIDIRSMGTVQTDNHGAIHIYQRRIDSVFYLHLRALYLFLEAHPNATKIAKIID
jgi:hypothetical protein